DELVLGEGTVVADVIGQGLAVDELGDDERLRGVELGVEHLGDAGMPDPPQRPRLPGQTPARGLVIGDMGVEALARYRGGAAAVTEVDDAAAARAALLDEAVGSEFLLHHLAKPSRASKVHSKD